MHKIIVNPFAGKNRAFKAIKHIKSYMQRSLINYEMTITDSPKQAIDFAFEAASNNYEVIIAVGGDGTINEILNGIMKSVNYDKINLGIIPLGSGNDFVKNFKFPVTIKNQVKIIKKQKIRKIDIGKIEDLYFINSLGIGFDAQVTITYQHNKLLKGFGGYLAALLRTLIVKKDYFVKIQVNDLSIEKNILFISVGNGICCGGKFYLTPQAKIDDGQFDICIADSMNRRRILKLLPKAIKGKHFSYPEASLIRSSHLMVTSEKDLPVYIDGEIPELKDRKNISIKILPQKINFIVP